MNSSQESFADFSAERFARIVASFEAELRQKTSDSDADDRSGTVIEEPCRLAPTVLRRRRSHA